MFTILTSPIMMTAGSVAFSVFVASGILGAGHAHPGSPDTDRLYGRVVTVDGDALEGYLRWDRSASHWADVLEGLKALPLEWEQQAEDLNPDYAALRRAERSLVAFGVRLTWDVDDSEDARLVPSGLRFAHVRQLEPVDSRTARVTLTSGAEIMLRASSTRLGGAIRGIDVDLPGGISRQVTWADLRSVEFFPAPAAAPPSDARRLFAAVRARGDEIFTGYVAWDRDEIFEADILDGRQNGREFPIAFHDIRRIGRASDRSAHVSLRNGGEVEIRGTNDVDRRNRGIEVVDPAFGRVIIPWDDFESADFDVRLEGSLRPVEGTHTPIRGTVLALDGGSVEGEVRWANDATHSWEFLRGFDGTRTFEIEFAAIYEIRRVGEERAAITLLNGRMVELTMVPDRGAVSRGIFVKPADAAFRLIRWQDFDRLTLRR